MQGVITSGTLETNLTGGSGASASESEALSVLGRLTGRARVVVRGLRALLGCGWAAARGVDSWAGPR